MYFYIDMAETEEDEVNLWNQVKIDGIWHNVDATYDSYLFHNNKEKMKCLVSDSAKYKGEDIIKKGVIVYE